MKSRELVSADADLNNGDRANHRGVAAYAVNFSVGVFDSLADADHRVFGQAVEMDKSCKGDIGAGFAELLIAAAGDIVNLDVGYALYDNFVGNFFIGDIAQAGGSIFSPFSPRHR